MKLNLACVIANVTDPMIVSILILVISSKLYYWHSLNSESFAYEMKSVEEKKSYHLYCHVNADLSFPGGYFLAGTFTIQPCVRGIQINVYSLFSSNSEADASELLEICEKMFPRFYIHCDVFSRQNSSTTQ